MARDLIKAVIWYLRAKVADVRRYGDKVTHIPEGSGGHYSARLAIFRRSRITASYRISMRIGIEEVTDREGIFTSHTSVRCHCRKRNLAFASLVFASRGWDAINFSWLTQNMLKNSLSI